MGYSGEMVNRRLLPILIVVAGLLPSAWLLFEFRDTPQLGFGGDDVMYIGAAQALVNQGSYREPALPGDPWQTKYPPGYPFMLAGILKLKLAARDFWLIAHSWIWLIAASFALAWAMLQTGLSRIQAATVAALWTANPAAQAAGTMALADAPYCTVLFLATGVVMRIGKASARGALLAGALIGLACLIRSAGLVAGLALFAWMAGRKSLRTAIWFSAGAVLPALIWTLWSRAHLPAAHDPITSFYLNYGGQWSRTVRQIGFSPLLARNIHLAVDSLGGWLVALSGPTLLRHVLNIFLLAFTVAALAEWSGGAFAAVALATVGFYLFWDFPPDGRLFLPVAPAFFGAAVAMLSSWPAIVRIFALVVVAVADIYGTADRAAIYLDQREAGIAPVYEFIRTELPADAVVLGDERVWLFTGRKTLGMPMPMEYFYLNQNDSAMAFFRTYKDVARRFGAGYILLGPFDGIRWTVPSDRRQEFAVTLRSDPNLDRIFSNAGVELFKLRP